MARVPAAGEFVEKTTVEGGTTQTGEKVIRFQDIPAEIHGRPVHLLGIFLDVTVPITTVAATMAAAAPGWLVETILSNFRLQVGTHQYIDGSSGFDAADVRVCAAQRMGRPVEAMTDLADADAGPTSTTIRLFIPFARLGVEGSKRYDGALAVSLFKNLASGNGLRFNVGTVPARGGAIAGVTIGAPTAIVARVLCAPLDDLRISTWQWRIRTINELWWEEDVPGPIEALVMASATAAGARDHVNLSAVKMQVDGQTVFDDLSATDLGLGASFLRGLPAGTTASRTDFVSSQGAVFPLPLIAQALDANRTKMPRGRVRLEFVDPTFTQRRVAVMSWGLRLGSLAEELKKQLGAPLDPANASRTDTFEKEAADAGNSGDVPMAAPGLDGKIYWRRMPFAIPRAKLAKAGG